MALWRIRAFVTDSKQEYRNMQKEEQLLERRLIELSRLAYHRDCITYSDFLNLNELNILHTLPKDSLYTKYVTFGGYESAERQMAAFLPDALSLRTEEHDTAGLFAQEFSVLKITPLQSKFSEDLSHRDYLGALLNLGIERGKVGDIMVGEKQAFVFVKSQLEDFLTEELVRIRHTSVLSTPVELREFHYTPRVEEQRGTVASVRLDSLLTVAFGSSRSKLSGLIEGGKVFVNGRLITSNGYQPKEEDVISVRGMGKFKYKGILSVTKKNRIYIRIDKYI